MDPVSFALFGGAIIKFLLDFAAIMLLAWIALEVCREVSAYLQKKRHETGLLYKRHAIDELINAAQDMEVKDDLRCIRDRHMGLLIPLDSDCDAVETDVCSVKATDYERDDLADKVVIADDESMAAMN